jgi:hypothetical protein
VITAFGRADTDLYVSADGTWYRVASAQDTHLGVVLGLQTEDGRSVPALSCYRSTALTVASYPKL